MTPLNLNPPPTAAAGATGVTYDRSSQEVGILNVGHPTLERRIRLSRRAMRDHSLRHVRLRASYTPVLCADFPPRRSHIHAGAVALLPVAEAEALIEAGAAEPIRRAE